MSDARGDFERYLHHWYEAFERGDATTLESLYTPDARLYLAGLPGVRGAPAIASLLGSFFKHAELACTHGITDVDLLSSQEAVLTGWSRVEVKARVGSAATRDASRFLMVMRRSGESGPWLCHYDMSQQTPDVA